MDGWNNSLARLLLVYSDELCHWQMALYALGVLRFSVQSWGNRGGGGGGAVPPGPMNFISSWGRTSDRGGPMFLKWALLTGIVVF